MSTMQSKPFVQKVLDSLTSAQKTTLAALINGSQQTPAAKSLINPSKWLTNADKGVSYITLETGSGDFTGYLVYNNSYCVLFAFSKGTQELTEIRIDPAAKDCSFVGETCSILEFRFAMEEAKEGQDVVGIVQSAIDEGGITVTEANVDSGESAADLILATDGDGGTEWKGVGEAISDGSESGAISVVLGFDSDGDLVTGTVTAGTVADGTLDKTSTNAIQNAPVATAIEAIEGDIAPSYDPPFAAGAYCVYGDKLYKAKQDIPSDEAWTAAHWEETDVGAELISKLTRGDYDATTGVGYADVAKSLETSVGNDDQTPFSFATVGIDSDVETGLQELRELVGCDVVDNQLIQNWNMEQSLGGWSVEGEYGSKSYANNKLTATWTGTQTEWYNNRIVLGSSIFQFLEGHKYYVSMYITNSFVSGVSIGRTGANIIDVANVPANTRTLINGVIAIDGTGDIWICCDRSKAATNGSTSVLEKVLVIDLTQRYGNNDVVNAIIGSDSSKYVANLIRFDPNILELASYDAGSFPTVKAAKLETDEYNQWDEEAEVGAINSSTGQNESASNRIRSKNYIQVKPGSTYYFYCGGFDTSINGFLLYTYDANKNFISYSVTYGGTFTLPANCAFIRFAMSTSYGTTYNHDISIFLYWDGSRIGYEPYQKHEITLPNERLHGILKVADGKVVADGDIRNPDGTGKTRYGTYTFTGSESFTKVDGTYPYYTMSFSGKNAADQVSTIRCDFGYTGRSVDTSIDKTRGIEIYSNILYIEPTTDIDTVGKLQTLLTGKTIIFKLATETDAVSTAFPSSFYGDDFGTMRFLDENGNEIPGLLGCDIFYRANIAGFAESIYVKTDGDPNDLVVQSELTAEQTARSAQDTALLNAVGGTLRQLLAVKETLDFDDTDFVDLGSLTWTRHAGSGIFYAEVSNKAGGNQKILCSKYAYESQSEWSDLSNNHITANTTITSKNIYINDTSYTDAAAFKAAMKGVLLAYEKASE